MTEKDFAIARVFRDVRHREGFWAEPGAYNAWVQLLDKLCAVLAADDPRFNRTRFRSACGITRAER